MVSVNNKINSPEIRQGIPRTIKGTQEMSIALDHLSDIEKAQLRHTRPDLFHYPVCGRCSGQVIAGECIQCGAEHDKQGNYLEPKVAVGINTRVNGRPPSKRHIR